MEMSEFWPTMAANFRDWPPADEIAAVRALIGDPPVVVPDVDWDGVHARLGLRLPAEYRAFIDSYGPGTVGDIRIMAPGQPAEWDLFALLDPGPGHRPGCRPARLRHDGRPVLHRHAPGLLDEGAGQTLVPPLTPRAPTAGQVRFSPRQQP
jgi:hypothetical protein